VSRSIAPEAEATRAYNFPSLHEIFERLRIKTENLNLVDRYCCISIDTMSLKANLFYEIYFI